MVNDRKIGSFSGSIVTILVLINAIILKSALLNGEKLYWALMLSIPLLAVALFNFNIGQKKPALLRKFQFF